MLSKCANPACSTPFRYLNQGRLFSIESATFSNRTHRPFECYWLCDRCARTLVVVIDQGVVTTRPRHRELSGPRGSDSEMI